MAIEVQGPDGSSIEFPDGTPPATIQKVMAQHYGDPKGGSPPAAAPDSGKRGLSERVKDDFVDAVQRGSFVSAAREAYAHPLNALLPKAAAPKVAPSQAAQAVGKGGAGAPKTFIQSLGEEARNVVAEAVQAMPGAFDNPVLAPLKETFGVQSLADMAINPARRKANIEAEAKRRAAFDKKSAEDPFTKADHPVLAGAGALLGTLAGGLTDPLNLADPGGALLPAAAKAVAVRKMGKTAADLAAHGVGAAAVNAGSDVVTQGADIRAGAQEGYAPEQTAMAAAAGPLILALFKSPAALRALADRARVEGRPPPASPADITPDDVAAVAQDPAVAAILQASNLPADHPLAAAVQQRLAAQQARQDAPSIIAQAVSEAASGGLSPETAARVQQLGDAPNMHGIVQPPANPRVANALEQKGVGAVPQREAAIQAVVNGEADPSTLNIPTAPEAPPIIAVTPGGQGIVDAGSAVGRDLRKPSLLPVPTEAPTPRMSDEQIAQARAASRGGTPNGAEPVDTLTAPEGRAPQTRDDVQGQRQAEGAFTLADRQRERASFEVRDTQTAGLPNGPEPVPVLLDEGFPVRVLERGKKGAVRVERYDPRTGQAVEGSTPYWTHDRALGEASYQPEPRRAQDFGQRDNPERMSPERPRMAGEGVRREDTQTYRATPQDEPLTPGEAGRSPLPEQPEGPFPGRDQPRAESAQRARDEEELRQRYERAQQEQADAQREQHARQGGAKASTNSPSGQGEDGRWITDDNGYVQSTKGGPVVFPDQKAAAKWIIKEGHAKSPDQIFELANHPHRKGAFTVVERGRSAPKPEAEAPAAQPAPQADAPKALPGPKAAVAELRGDEIAPKTADLTTLREAAKRFFETHLRGKTVRSEALGKDVKFLNARKSLSASAKPEKLRLFPALPEMIANGRLIGSVPNKRADINVKAFHFLEATAGLDGAEHRVTITLREDRNGHVYYNHGLEDDPKAPTPPRAAASEPGLPGNGGVAPKASPETVRTSAIERGASEPGDAGKMAPRPETVKAEHPRSAIDGHPAVQRAVKERESAERAYDRAKEDPDLSKFNRAERRLALAEAAEREARKAAEAETGGETPRATRDLASAPARDYYEGHGGRWDSEAAANDAADYHRNDPGNRGRDVRVVRQDDGAYRVDVERTAANRAAEEAKAKADAERADRLRAQEQARSFDRRASLEKQVAKAQDAYNRAREGTKEKRRAAMELAATQRALEEHGFAAEAEPVPATPRRGDTPETAKDAKARIESDLNGVIARARELDAEGRGTDHKLRYEMETASGRKTTFTMWAKPQLWEDLKQRLMKSKDPGTQPAEFNSSHDGTSRNGKVKVAYQEIGPDGKVTNVEKEVEVKKGHQPPAYKVDRFYSNPMDPEAVKGLLLDPAMHYARLAASASAKAITAALETAKKVGHDLRPYYDTIMSTNGQAMRLLGKRYGGEIEKRVQAIADAVATDPGSGRAIAQTFGRAVEQRTMTLANRMGEIIGHKPDAAVMDQIGDILSGRARARAGSPEAGMAAKLRALLDAHHEYLTKAGVEVGYVKGRYFPRIVDEGKVQKNTAGFLEQAAKVYREMGLSKVDADKAADEWLARIQGVTDSAFAPGIPSSAHTRGRALPPSADTLLKDFYLTDPRDALLTYFRQTARVAEATRRFGKNGEGIAQKFNELRRMGMDPRDVQRLQAHFDSSTGYLFATNAPNAYRGFGWIQTAGVLALLPRATLASVPEAFAIGVRTGDAMVGLKALGDSFRELTKFRQGDDARQAAELIGVVGDALNTMLAQTRYEGDPGARAQSRLVHKFFQVNGLLGITEAQRVVAVRIGRQFVHGLLEDVAKGNSRWRTSQRMLDELGIDRDGAHLLKTYLDKHDGGFPPGELGGNSREAELYRSALQRFVDESIQNPSAADKPLYANHPFGRMAYGITSFMFSATKNVTARTFRETREAFATGKGYTLDDRLRLLGPAIAYGALFTLQSEWSDIRDMVTNPQGYAERTTMQQELVNWSRASVWGNFDPLVNLVNQGRYQRDASSVMTGPYLAYFGQQLLNIAGGFSTPAQGNSPNTNNAEWGAARSAYAAVVAPISTAILTNLAGEAGLPGRVAAFGAMHALTAPGTSRAAADATVGPRTVTPKGRNADGNALSRGTAGMGMSFGDGFGEGAFQ